MKSIFTIACIACATILLGQELANGNFEKSESVNSTSNEKRSMPLVGEEDTYQKNKNVSDTTDPLFESITGRADSFYSATRYDSALLLYKSAIKILEARHQSRSIEFVRYLNLIGIIQKEKGNYKEAESTFKKAINILSTHQSARKDVMAVLKGNIGNLFKIISNYQDAEKNLLESAEFFENNTPIDSSALGLALSNLTDLYMEFGNLEKAEPILRRAQFINRNNLIENASTLNRLGLLYTNKGDYQKAYICFEEAINIYKNKIPVGSAKNDYAGCLNNLGLLCMDDGKFIKAKIYLNDALIIYMSIPYSDQSIADVNNNLGLVNLELDDLSAAKECFEKALDSYKSLNSSSSNDQFIATFNLAIVYQEQMDFKTADSLMQLSLRMKRGLKDDNPSDLSTLYRHLGDLRADESRYKEAEEYFLTSISYGLKIMSHEPISLFMAYRSIGLLYIEIGDYQTSLAYFQKCEEFSRRKFDENHPNYSSALHNMGYVYSFMDDFDRSLLYYSKSLKIYKTIKDSLSTAQSLNNIGNLYFDKKEYLTAGKYYDSSIQLIKLLSKNSTRYLQPYANKCLVSYELGDYSLAINQLKSLLSEHQFSISSTPLKFIPLWHELATFYIKNGQVNESKKIYDSLLLIKTNQIADDITWMSAAQRISYWQKEAIFFDRLYTFTASSSQTIQSGAALAYNASLISKSLLMETSCRMEEEIQKSTDIVLQRRYHEFKQLRRLISSLESSGSENLLIIKQAKIKADSLDKFLTKQIKDYKTLKTKFTLTWSDVRSSLTKNEAAIEFVRFQDLNDSSYRYLALVLRPTYEYPKTVLLGKETVIQEAIKKRDFTSLYENTWSSSLDSLLMQVNTVYYSPTGELNNVAFSAICLQTSMTDSTTILTAPRYNTVKPSSSACNKVLIDRYVLHQLTSTRYIADETLRNDRIINPSILLIGGINYNELPIPTAEKHFAAISNEKNSISRAIKKNIQWHNTQNKSNKRGLRGVALWDYLPGTKTEVQNIRTVLKNNKWNILIKVDKNASENYFKIYAEKNNPSVIHVATHGFAFREAQNVNMSPFGVDQYISYKYAEDPMIRCGLMLSGSNISWTGNPRKMIDSTGEDGILTAAEVANLNLSKTKLVVLSACETGLGKIEGMEGTFGLKRGYKLAGVEQLVVSLWKVPDDETQELMTNFYRDLAVTYDPVASFDKAQRALRHKYPTQPDKWAGFVLIR